MRKRGRPRRPFKTRQLGTHISAVVYDALRAEADERKEPLTRLVERILRSYIESQICPGGPAVGTVREERKKSSLRSQPV